MNFLFPLFIIPTILISGRFNISLNGDNMFGSTKYGIQILAHVEPTDTNVLLESELEFPLQVVRITLDGNFSLLKRRFFINWGFRVSKNPLNPLGRMTDSDWLTYPYPYGTKVLYIYSESVPILNGFWANLHATAGIKISKILSIYMKYGIKQIKLDYKMYGVNGWYLDTSFQRVNFNEYTGELVGTYSVTYNIQFEGWGFKLKPFYNTSLMFTALYSPHALVDDYDDHVLRNLSLYGHTGGRFVDIDIEGEIRLPSKKREGLSPLSLIFAVRTNKISTKGERNYFWYGDDPSTSGDDTGTTITGIDTYIESFYQTVTIGLKYNF